MKSINWKEAGINLLAVVIGVVVYRLVVKQLSMGDVTETMFGASGGGCSVSGSPTFPTSSYACQQFECCSNSGGVVNYTSNGNGTGSMECLGGSFCAGSMSMVIEEPIRAIRPTRKFVF